LEDIAEAYKNETKAIDRQNSLKTLIIP